MTPQIQNADLALKLQRQLGVRGGRAGFDLDYTMVPVVIVADVRDDQESGAFGDRAVIGRHVSPPVAGQAQKLGLFNPADSDMEIDVAGFVGFVSGGGEVLIGFRNSVLGTPAGISRFLNTRFATGGASGIAPGALPVGQLSQQSSVGLHANAFGKFLVDTAGTFTRGLVPLGITLAPGEGIELNSVTLNVNFEATFYWLERALSAVPAAP